MKPDLEPAKRIIRGFSEEWTVAEENSKKFSTENLIIGETEEPEKPKNPEPILRSNQHVDLAYTWLYLSQHYHGLLPRQKVIQVPEFYQQAAALFYQKWFDQEKDVILRGCVYIPHPENLSLMNYLQKTRDTLVETVEKRHVWIDSLRSFTSFLRKNIPLVLQGPLEGIFPAEMAIQYHHAERYTKKDGFYKEEQCYILRRVDDEIPSIDIWAFSDVLQILAKRFLEGRQNSQESAAQALGFACLCHAVASARITTRTAFIHSSSISALKCVGHNKPECLFYPQCHISIQSLSGLVDVPISRTLCNFLLALPRQPEDSRIFTMSEDTLLRTLRAGVKKSKLANKHIPITFRTFISLSHEAFRHRSIPSSAAKQSEFEQR
jgi:hypothetical protein